jgi:WD40 repeat protein
VVRFAGTTPISKIKAHTSKITNISMATDGRFAISAANSIKLYDSKFRCIIVIDTDVLGVRHPISSLCWHAETRKILMGTEGNEVWEISSDDGSNINKGPLVNAHASSPMAICANPNGTTFATVSDDGFLRVWDDENTSFDLTMPSRACAYSPDGRMLAVGFGKPVKDSAKTMNGKWVIIDVTDSSYRIIAERRDSRKYIRETKWHSNGDRLAVGSDKIYVYQLTTETNPAIKVDISLVSTIELISPAIHFDFSMDGKYIRVNSDANELMWFEADPAIRVKEASLMKDIEWESETSIFGWNVQGTHRDGTTVRSLDCYTTEDCSSVVTGGDEGVLRLYTYPCTSTRSSYLSYAGHDGAVASVVILKGGSHVVSTGEHDHAVMVWRHEIDESYNDRLLSEQKESVIDAGDDDETQGICYAAFYDSNHQIIYPTSGICVVLDETRSTQNLFQRHDSQIGAVVTSTSRQLVASGDIRGDFPSVRIWDPRTCTEIAALSDSRLRGVSVLAFSPDDKSLACVCSDENHRIFVWSTMNGEWSDAYLSTFSLGDHEKISFVQFTQTHLITGGRNNLNFWSFVPTLSVSKRVLSTQCQGETFLCGAVMGDKLVTGTSNGNFVTWDLTEKKILSEFKAHNNGCVTFLCACPEGIVSASSDGLVTIWSSDLEKMHSFDVGTKSPIHSLDIRPHSNGQSTIIILALSDSTCFEISCITGRVVSVANIPSVGEVSTC